MKVGIIFPLNSYGGVQTCVIALVKGLNQLGIEPVVLSESGVNEDIVSEHRLKLSHDKIDFFISGVTVDKYQSLIKGARDLISFFKTSSLKKKYDFLYIFQPNVIVDSATPYLYYLSMSPRSPGFSGATFLPWLKFFLYDYVIKFFLPVYEFKHKASHCVINSHFTEQMFYETYGEHLEVVYPPSLVKVQATMNIKSREGVLFLSRIVREKRPELFIQLCESFPELKFYMVGSCMDKNYLAELETLVRAKGVKNLEIHTNLSFQAVQAFLCRCKFYVFPGINEHFGITTAESMLFGVIPFVHNSGGQKEIVPFEQLRFNDDEFIEMFRALVNLSEAELASLQEKILKHAQEFSEGTYIKKMTKFLPVL